MNLNISVEKKEQKGEDASFYKDTNTSTIAVVMDGMGGAGCIQQKHENILQTEARISANTLKQFFETNFEKISALKIEEFETEIQKMILNCLKDLEKNYKIEKSPLKNSFSRRFPSTIAGWIVYKQEKKIIAFWAGDSRCYTISKDGMKQISKDDVKEESPQHLPDAPLSNCLCADKPFHINTRVLDFEDELIYAVCTDGCYGYFPTILHFEKEILTCLNKKASMEELKQNLIELLKPIAHDDFSWVQLSTSNSFDFDTHLSLLNDWISKYKEAKENIIIKKNELEYAKSCFLEMYNDILKEYNRNYIGYEKE